MSCYTGIEKARNHESNYTHRLICALLCLALLVCSPYATGETQPGAEQEVSLPSTNLPPALDSTNVIQPRRNIIWYVKYGKMLANESLNQEARQTIAFTASYNQAFLSSLVGLRSSNNLAANGTLATSTAMNTDNTVLMDIYFTYVGRAFSSINTTIGDTTVGPGYYKVRYKDVLLECRFESNWDFDPTHFAVTNSHGNAMETEWVLLGDVDRDQDVDGDDAQLILEYSTDQSGYLSDLALTAADVNEDGIVDASDTLLILQYNSGQINSFWKSYSAPSSLPTTETEGIVDGGTYTLQNVYNGNGITGPSSSTSSVEVPQVMLNTAASRQQFVVSYKGSGEYEIRSKSLGNLVWTRNSSNKLVLQTRTSTPSSAQRWYIIPSTDGSYQFINKAQPTRCLTVQGDSDTIETEVDGVAIGTSVIGNRWRMYRDVGRISTDYYDASFFLRYKTANIPLTNAQGTMVWTDVLYNSHPVRLIGDARSEAIRIFGSVLGVSMRYASVVAYESTADACREARGISLTSYYANGASGSWDRCTSTTGIHAHGTYPANSPYGYANQAKHCTDELLHNDQFEEDHSSTNSKRFDTFWTGATLYRQETTGYTLLNRSYAWVNGPKGSFIHVTNLYDDGLYAPGLTNTYIHEVAHQWDAPDHYHEVVNGVCNSGAEGRCSEENCISFIYSDKPNKKHRSKACMMNTTDQLDQTKSTQKLFCTDCVQDMKAFVEEYY